MEVQNNKFIIEVSKSELEEIFLYMRNGAEYLNNKQNIDVCSAHFFDHFKSSVLYQIEKILGE